MDYITIAFYFSFSTKINFEIEKLSYNTAIYKVTKTSFQNFNKKIILWTTFNYFNKSKKKKN